MTLAELPEALRVAGVRLSLRLVVDAPVGALTAELRDALAEHKPALMARLARDAEWASVKDVRWGDGVTDSRPGIEIGTPAGGHP